MRIVIDLQAAQGASRFRGIGRYSLAFSLALAREAQQAGRGHEVWLALSGAFPESIESIRAAFDGLIPQSRIRVWDAPRPTTGDSPESSARRRVAEQIREAFLASLYPDWVVVCSLFEGYAFMDEAVTSIGRVNRLPTAVVFYDLIPFIYPDAYLTDEVRRRWYHEKLDHLRRADRLLAISASSAREAVDYLGFARETVVAIGTDADAQFRPLTVTGEHRAHLGRAYGITRPFALYVGGADVRKNCESLIEAYARLPAAVRSAHQLVFAFALDEHPRQCFAARAQRAGLGPDEFIMTGFVPDDDLLLLYNACTAFVFPAWHEGFGLPPLEAMRCGKAVLAANRSSLPEVIGREDALFDPFDVADIAGKLERALTDTAWRRELEAHAAEQQKKFSWAETARRAWAALEAAQAGAPQLAAHAARAVSAPASAPVLLHGGLLRRPRLAWVSPLPPEKTGIADYSAQLLPDLCRWYEVEVVVAQPEVGAPEVTRLCPVRSLEHFLAHARDYDRVVYHLGNSTFHTHMLDLLPQVPGIVVLHDFFLSNFIEYLDATGARPGLWPRALFESHGFAGLGALMHAVHDVQREAPAAVYPANLALLQHAQGVIVHSQHSLALARRYYYGVLDEADWAVLPMPRALPGQVDRAAARCALGLAPDDLLVCSFGFAAPTKLSLELLEGWLASPLAARSRARLVFVGDCIGGAWGDAFRRRIAAATARGVCVELTGFVSAETYRHYLAAADLAVQLRTQSRGETSAEVYDCLGYGLPTLVNAHGSLAELPDEFVHKLPDRRFTPDDLAGALESLAADATRRSALGTAARAHMFAEHHPRAVAARYAGAIEQFARRAAETAPGALRALASSGCPPEQLPALAATLAVSFPPRPRPRQWLVDVSELVQRDAKSGIQRVVRSVLAEWLRQPPAGYRCEPVFLKPAPEGGHTYHYARRWAARFLGFEAPWLADEPVEAYPGDVFVGLDLYPQLPSRRVQELLQWRDRGVAVVFVVYDLLPLQMPECFDEPTQRVFTEWVPFLIGQADGAVAISRAVAQDLVAWLARYGPPRLRPFRVGWFHLGADIEQSLPTRGMPEGAAAVLARLWAQPSFLMVGTIEPRKGHAQTLAAFEALWARAVAVNLVIVGQPGWRTEALVEQLRGHPQAGKRLFWLEAISDEYLEAVYAASAALIAASYGEGFGLPLIEAARHKLPIIARDIPVFREVAGEHAFYFADDRAPETIASAIEDWLARNRQGNAPQSAGMPYLTWAESAAQLTRQICAVVERVDMQPADEKGADGYALWRLQE